MVMPTFEETVFVCKNCGKIFFGRDCGRIKKKPIPPFSPGLLPPKCPECGSRKTEKNMAVCY